jgi:hypothetical protein
MANPACAYSAGPLRPRGKLRRHGIGAALPAMLGTLSLGQQRHAHDHG